jgi:hypothetical protein
VAGELHNPKAILANSNNPYLVIKAVLEQSSGLIFTCQPKKCELFQKEVEFLGRVV